VRAFFQLIVLGSLATPAGAQSLQVFGYAGVLGEWELTATVTEKAAQRTKEFSGPLAMKHVGVCTKDGPEQKTGEIRFQIFAASMLGSSSRMQATLVVDGVECTYSAKLSGSYTGLMNCPDRPAVPLILWAN
jgi:hypothetical protein